jgi:hypothetical protein
MARSRGFGSGLRHRVLRRSGLLLSALAAAGGAAFVIAACGTTNAADTQAGSPDATADTTTTTPEAGKDGTAPKPDGAVDAGGNCTVVKGVCDLVLQDCPDDKGQKQECVVSSANTTVCQPVQASQQLPKGRACCPSPTSNPCLPGLACIGNECTDGGPQTGRCSPACCKGNDLACGKSDPEGISGACDLTIVAPVTNAPLHEVCTYANQCKPFKQQPCNAGDMCIVEDKFGTASCVNSFGKTNRQPCSFSNDCADGLLCLGGDAGSCHVVCLVPGTTSPFDASVAEGGPGLGGCPVGEKCSIQFSNRPDWFGSCAYTDGG